MELKHFSHDHPLILCTEHMYRGVQDSCYGCELPISDQSYYGCNRCIFFLHKSCAEVPREITHPSHPDHPLSLHPNPLYDCFCDVCRETCNRFTYNCSICFLDVHMKCASVVHSIEHQRHRHPLISLQKPAMFSCDACGTKHEGTSYLCSTCGFWVNQKCLDLLPNTIKLSHHHHHLTLIYSNPFEYDQSGPSCEICDERVYRKNWVYYCSDSECRYFVHANCGMTKTEYCKTDHNMINLGLQDPELNQIEPDPVVPGIATTITELSKYSITQSKAEGLYSDLVTLRMLDESIDLITQFLKDIRIKGKYEEETEIRHISHEHPLVFYDKQMDHESSSGRELLLLTEVKNDEKCNGCLRTISAPFYHCAQCKFFLHEWCAELPDELQHPCHPEHPLLLTTNSNLYRCGCCRVFSNAFKFGCSACKFFLDSRCTFLPRIIKHEAHEHIFALRKTRSEHCSACAEFIDFGFVCDPCNNNVCISCVLLPRKVQHRYDKHPFSLTYPPPLKEDQADDNIEYICEICEGEIDFNSKRWFYHCGVCDQSLHMNCIHPVDWLSNVKYGITVNLKYHQHPLTFVPKPEVFQCRYCDSKKFPAYECVPCNFCMCAKCFL